MFQQRNNREDCCRFLRCARKSSDDGVSSGRRHKKGDVLSVARLAGILGAKKTPELIPLCHPLALTSAELDLRCDEKLGIITITSKCKINARTGVEMEALTAVSIAALTIYDMCKAVDKGIIINNIRLLEKTGGKSGQWRGK